MMMKRRAGILGALSMLSLCWMNSATAEIWCNGGTIVHIGNVIWNESAIYANYPGIIPDDIPPGVVGNVEIHIASEAMFTYGEGFVGGGGGFGGYSVPNSGDVKTIAYAPFSYTNIPSAYHTSYGLNFNMYKCYTIPPMARVETFEHIQLPQWPLHELPTEEMIVRPMEGIQGLEPFWMKVEANGR